MQQPPQTIATLTGSASGKESDRMGNESKVTLLRRVPGLAAFGDRQLVALLPLVDEMELPPGHALMIEGRPGQEVFLVVEGEAEVTLRGDVIGRIGPGEFAGEMALIDHNPRSATVTSLTAMRVLVISPSSFASMLNQPAVCRSLARDLTRRLRSAEQAPTYDLPADQR